jgi:hypothetical protein
VKKARRKTSESKPGPKGPPPLKIEGDTMRAFAHFLGAAQRKKQIKMIIEARLGKKPKS